MEVARPHKTLKTLKSKHIALLYFSVFWWVLKNEYNNLVQQKTTLHRLHVQPAGADCH